MTDFNHRIAKTIVNSCKPGDVIVMEDLHYIRERIRVAKEQHLLQHSWAFGQLGRFIEYKAAERGLAVVYVNPATPAGVAQGADLSPKAAARAMSSVAPPVVLSAMQTLEPQLTSARCL